MHKRAFQPITKFSTLFFAPDKGSEGGAGKPTLEQQLASALSDLTSANDSLSTMTGERDKALADVTSITSERDNLKSQFDDATSTAAGLRTDLDAANGKITSITSERDQARKDLDSATANISRLEKLCSLKGIDPKAAVTPDTTPDAPKSAAEFQTALSNCKTQAERDKVLSEFSAAAKGGKLATV